jgi:hypothetical protein
VNVSLQIDASAGPAASNVNVGVSFNWGGTISDTILALTNFPAFLAKKAIERALSTALAPFLRNKLRSKFSGLLSYRFDRGQDLAGPGGPAQISGIFPARFGGSRDPHAAGYVDILIVADGFAAGDFANFDDFATFVATYLTGTPERPFAQFLTGVRIWKLTLIAANPVDPLQRCLVPVNGPDRETFNFSNLARIAEIGLTAREFLGRDPIVVFASQISDADRMNAGVALDADLRENTQGPFVLLNVAGVSAQDAASRQSARQTAMNTLIHELGHTPLGRYLSDEYAANRMPPRIYHGLEPHPRNVSLNPFSGWAKWQPWSDGLVGFLPQALADESAYEFDRAIFRFAPACRMRTSGGGDFCNVCVEELTLGLLAHGHQTIGSGGVSGMVDLRLEYLSPFIQTVPLHVEGGRVAQAAVFAPGGGDHTNTRLRLTLVGSSVPASWLVSWTVTGVGGFGTTAQLTGSVVEIGVVQGSTIRLEVRHDLGTHILGSSQPPPVTSIDIMFDQARVIAAADLQPPANLQQSVALGAVLGPIIDPASGDVHLPAPLWLQAQIGGVQGYSVPTSIRFHVQGPGNVALTFDSLSGASGETRRWLLDRVPPARRYVWSAQTVWHSLRSALVQAPRAAGGDCFEIGSLPFTDKPTSPVDPFALEVLETATIPPSPSGLQASSWSPNDRKIKFQFEFKPVDVAYDGQNLSETGLLDRDRSNLNSVAITGSIALINLFPRRGHDSDFFKWRVRAVDDRQRAGNWVEGRQFAIYLVAQRPTTVANLVNLIDQLDRAVFAAGGGPLDIPRVFFIPQAPIGDKEMDFSGLDRLLIRDRPGPGDGPRDPSGNIG